MTSIVTNTAAKLAQGNLTQTFKTINDSVQRLTSGNRIVSAADDAAGLAIGTGLRTDVSTLNTALANTSQATSLLSVADGALQAIGEILQRQKSLAVQANSGSLSSTELAFLNTEFQELKTQIDDIASQTNFNGIALLDGTASGVANVSSNTTGTVNFTDVGTAGETALSDTAADASLFVIDNTTNDNLSLQGSLSGNVTVEIVNNSAAANDVDFLVTIDGFLYKEVGVDVNGSAGTDLTVSLVNAATGQEITLVLDGTNAVDAIDNGGASNQTLADSVATLIQADLQNITVLQDRNFQDGTSGTVFNTNDIIGTVIEGLTGSSFTLRSDSFNEADGSAPTIEEFSITAETTSTDGQIAVVIGGSSFETSSGTFDSNASDVTTAVTLTNQDDNNETLIINFANADSGVALNNTLNATALATGLNAGFGIGSSGSLNFQVGLTSSDTIAVSIAKSTTASLYTDASGNLISSINLLTTTAANTASTGVDNAIDTVLSTRASVGALQSRFGFAASNLSTTITNLDTARGEFLDTNVAEEATDFAGTQVLQTAGVSILAQANQIPQLLLKLLG